jgi:hypothetical protein
MSFLSTVDLYGRKRLQVVPPEDGKPVPPFLTRPQGSSSPTMNAALDNLRAELGDYTARTNKECAMTQEHYRDETTPLESVAAMISCLTYGDMKQLADEVATHLEGNSADKLFTLADALHKWAQKKTEPQP